MTRGVKIRLLAFVALSAIGIVYVAGSFLGITDRLLGRGLTIHATLPTSGGLFTGSEVTYRGVKVGKVSGMHVTRKGLRLDLALKDGTKIPMDSKMYVHNLSAVGEQYLDFEPPDDKPPYAEAGDVIKGNKESLPMSEEVLLTRMNSLVDSVDKTELSTVVDELGTMFRDTANPLQRMVDSGTQFVDEADANTDEHDHAARHRQDRAADAGRPREGHPELREGPGRPDRHAAQPPTRTSGPSCRAAPALSARSTPCCKGLEPTLPVFLSNLITTNQVLTTNIPALEQLLVLFPHVIAAGFTGTPGRRLRPHQPAVQQQRPALHQGLQAALAVA